MMSIFTTLLFGAAFLASIATILASVRPHGQRILFLLRYGPVIGAELPPLRRATVRAVPAHPAARPVARRAAA